MTAARTAAIWWLAVYAGVCAATRLMYGHGPTLHEHAAVWAGLAVLAVSTAAGGWLARRGWAPLTGRALRAVECAAVAAAGTIPFLTARPLGWALIAALVVVVGYGVGVRSAR